MDCRMVDKGCSDMQCKVKKSCHGKKVGEIKI
jgi:hypothetical protein